MQCVRSQAYLSHRRGGAVGHCFGNGKIWGFFDGWQDALESDGAKSMVAFDNLVHSRSWELLVPDYEHRVLTAGYGNIDSLDYAAAARICDGGGRLYPDGAHTDGGHGSDFRDVGTS